MKRYKHSLSHYKLLTCDMGELVPVANFEVLPGDSVQQATSALIRVSPLLAPVMHPVSVRFHTFFVPYRLVWAGWEDFITGGPDGIGGAAGVYPTITSAGGFAAGSLTDYMGVRPAVANTVISALPVRAYNLIFNEYYRDEDLVTELAVPTASGADATSPTAVQKVAWEKDYFTSARPWTQKGPAVTLPLGTEAPVVRDPLSGALPVGRIRVSSTGNLVGGASTLNVDASGNFINPSVTNLTYDPNGSLIADLSAATSVDVNTVREAFAIQRYQEARARYGSRYTEYLRYLGVRSSDARLQRPEYLGGGKQTISFSEVLQTGTDFDANDGVATLRGHGIAAMRSRRYRRFFEEHGVVITLMSVRPRTIYQDGLERMWSRRIKEEYWQRELERIGQQEVYKREVYMQGTAADAEVFGYQDRYAEYRHLPSQVVGEFRSTLNFWHLARAFGSLPALNSSFVTCDPSKRINAVQTNDVLWVMCSHSIQARRMVSKSAASGIY